MIFTCCPSDPSDDKVYISKDSKPNTPTLCGKVQKANHSLIMPYTPDDVCGGCLTVYLQGREVVQMEMEL
jgi:hypothetical protein